MSEPETECPAALQVSLAPVTDVDLEAFFEHGREPDGRWLAAFTASDPNDRAAFDWHWRRIRSDPSVEVRTILWNGRVAGHILRYESKFKQHEVSYWIGSAFWGHGIATAALKEFLRTFALMRPLYARVAADNLGSLRVLEACGFRTYAEETSFANARQDDILEYLLRLDRYEAVPFDSEAARSLTLAAHDVYWKLRSTLRLYAGQLKSPEIETLAQEMELVPQSKSRAAAGVSRALSGTRIAARGLHDRRPLRRTRARPAPPVHRRRPDRRRTPRRKPRSVVRPSVLAALGRLGALAAQEQSDLRGPTAIVSGEGGVELAPRTSNRTMCRFVPPRALST